MKNQLRTVATIVFLGIGTVCLSQGVVSEGVQLQDLAPKYEADPINDYQHTPTPQPRETWIESERKKQDYRDHNETQLSGKVLTDPKTGKVNAASGSVTIPY